MARRTIAQPGRIYVRHITPDPASPHVVLGRAMRADARGPNGQSGWQTATYDDRVGEHGDFRVDLPNAPGADGRMHRDRFAIFTDPAYHPGDEWVELWRHGDEHPLYVGTPSKRTITRSKITVEGVDARATEVLGKQRETAAAFLLGSPHDVVADLCTAWVAPAHQDFTSPDAPAMASGGIEETTADGTLRHIRATSGPQGVLLAPAGATAYVQTVATIPTGRTQAPWRAECTVRRATVNADVTLAVDQASQGAADRATLAITGATTATVRSGAATHTADQLKLGASVHLAIEGRGRWAFFYVDGALVTTLPVEHPGPLARTVTAKVTGTVDAHLRMLLARRREAFITPLILDRRTPGTLPLTGLLGAYHSEQAPPTGEPVRTLVPTKEPYARRIDATIAFADAGGVAPAWQPTGSTGEWMGVRWTGSIYLDLDARDTRLRVTVDDQARVLIADTREGSEYLTATNATVVGPWLRAHLPAGQPRTGWFAIVIEYSNQGGDGGITLQAEHSDSATVWRTPGDRSDPLAPALSHLGVYEHYARHDSFAEQIAEVQRQTGVQTRLRPRSLESGQFPAAMEIAPRVGRDTDLIIDEVDATDTQNSTNAADVASTLITDIAAQGTDGPASVEVFAHDQLDAGHLLIHQDTESLAGIIDRALLEQRAQSISAIRSTMGEELTARPRGHRELADTFPLTGVLAEHRWEAGDGVRCHLDDIAVHDETPRQMLGVSWTVVPDGAGAPTVSWRQRPAGLRQVLRALARRVALDQRASRP